MSGLLVLVYGMLLALTVAACGRGSRSSGPSWFDLPLPTGRAARRSR